MQQYKHIHTQYLFYINQISSMQESVSPVIYFELFSLNPSKDTSQTFFANVVPINLNVLVSVWSHIFVGLSKNM